jgi:hypothetical protein
MKLCPEIRSPWADESRRINGLVPSNAEALAYRVAVVGRVERIAAAAVLYRARNGLDDGVGFVRFAGAGVLEGATIVQLVQSLREAATAIGWIQELRLVSSVDVTQPLYEMLRDAQFEPHRRLDLYRMQLRALQPRIESVFQRLAARGRIPADARITSPHGDWIPKLRDFLECEKPGLSDRIESETEGFALEHSLLLVIGDAVAGVLFTRNRGAESFLGLILVTRALRGGIAWANAYLIREVLLDGLESGVEHVIFEAHADDHRGTSQLAKATGAERISTRWQFRAKLRDYHSLHRRCSG